MQLKINGMTRPTIDTTPRLSIIYPDDEYAAQKCAHISVFCGDDEVFEKDVDGNARSFIPLEFDMLPNRIYDVIAESVTENGKKYREKTRFSSGKLGGAWSARWISASDAYRCDDVLGAIYLRREFNVKNARRATLFIAGLGYFEAHINGKKVGDDFLSTPFTSYDKRITYRAFDVTDMLTDGDNAIGVILGNGFYNCFTIDPWQSASAPWRDVPKLLCELVIEDDSGEFTVKSDKSWQCVHGPITFNGIRHGEEYDARLECSGWDRANFAGNVYPSRYVKSPGALLEVIEMEPVRVLKKYTPVCRRKVKNGWLYELTQDIAGICNITFSGRAGTKFTMRYCDILDSDGELDQSAINSFIKNYTFQTDVYIKKSDGRETWHPIFTYHGFQYIEISGCDTPPECSDVEAWALCNDFEPRGSFSSSDETVNYIQHMCLFSTTSCCMNTFASDTVREKNSWTGDTGLSVEQLLLNFGAENFMKKWMTDMRDAMRPGGALPCVVPSTGWGYNSINGPDWSHPVYEVPLRLYMMTGDVSYIYDNIEALRRHCEYVASMARDDGTVRYGLGDWCAPFDGPALSVNMSSFKCPVDVSDTAFYYSALKTLLYFANVIGKNEIIEKYAPIAEKTRQAFRNRFFDKSTYTVSGDCQSATGIMVYHGLCDEDEIEPLGRRLCEQIHRDGDKLDFGVLGMKAVLDTLGRTNNTATALKILTNPEYPSVRHWIDMGATVMWECWNGEGSRNHHMFSAVSAFFYKYIAGISIASPSGREIDFCPGISSGLDFAGASLRTPWGAAGCKWKVSGGEAEIEITVPSSCVGRLHLADGVQKFSAGVHKIKNFFM